MSHVHRHRMRESTGQPLSCTHCVLVHPMAAYRTDAGSHMCKPTPAYDPAYECRNISHILFAFALSALIWPSSMKEDEPFSFWLLGDACILVSTL
jgi:hypothetical protein